MDKFVSSYLDFLTSCKTERRCVSYFRQKAQEAGYRNLEECTSLRSGDKVWYSKMNKAIILFEIGSEPISRGMKILGAHIDAPRLDIKQKPFYERDGLVYINTHYYGGIKKYQWLAMPLAIYGLVCLKDGRTIDIAIGDDPDDPVFFISDILPHIAQSQMSKSASEFIDAEKLDLISGCIPASEIQEKDEKDKKDAAKNRILAILKDKYAVEEQDFMSAELEVVPAGKARLAGFDKSLVLSYGQDDRVCAYSSFCAMIESQASERTKCCILCDKEEIGSNGATGMDSLLLENAVAEVTDRLDIDQSRSSITVRRALSNSIMLSSDVNSAYDPLNADLYDKENSSCLGGGVVFNKYTGARGKSGASDANAEYMAFLRARMDSENVRFQTAELAKVDVGGGGTIAKYCAYYGMNVIDCGVPVMSMHAPWEAVAVYDIQQAFGCYKAFLKSK